MPALRTLLFISLFRLLVGNTETRILTPRIYFFIHISFGLPVVTSFTAFSCYSFVHNLNVLYSKKTYKFPSVYFCFYFLLFFHSCCPHPSVTPFIAFYPPSFICRLNYFLLRKLSHVPLPTIIPFYLSSFLPSCVSHYHRLFYPYFLYAFSIPFPLTGKTSNCDLHQC